MKDVYQNFLERLTKVETILDNLVNEISEIKSNHLSHIRKELEDLKFNITNRPSWLVTFIITTLVSLVTGLIIVIMRAHV